MSLRSRAVNFRANEETVRQIDDIKGLFHPLMADRSSVLRWIIKTMWMLLFTETSLSDLFCEWQVIHRQKMASGELQMRFHFPAQDGYSLTPRIWRAQ